MIDLFSPAWSDDGAIALFTSGVFIVWLLGQLTVDLYRSRDRR